MFLRYLQHLGLLLPLLGTGHVEVPLSVSDYVMLGSASSLRYAAQPGLVTLVLRSTSSDSLLLLRRLIRVDSFFPSVGQSRLGSPALALDFALLGPALSPQSLAHPELVMLLLDLAAVASFTLARSFAHADAAMPITGRAWFGSATLLLDLLQLESIMLLRSLSRVEPSTLLLNFAHLSSSVFARNLGRFGAEVFARSNVRPSSALSQMGSATFGFPVSIRNLFRGRSIPVTEFVQIEFVTSLRSSLRLALFLLFLGVA